MNTTISINWVHPETQTEIRINNLKWDLIRWRWLKDPKDVTVDVVESAPFEFTRQRTFKGFCRTDKNIMFVQFDSNVYAKIFVEESDTIVMFIEVGFVTGDGDHHKMYEFIDHTIVDFDDTFFVLQDKCTLFRY